jgi:hypothetical protein
MPRSSKTTLQVDFGIWRLRALFPTYYISKGPLFYSRVIYIART